MGLLNYSTAPVEPFLYICVIASTRRILTIGAQIVYIDEVSEQIFNRYLLDLGANVLVIVALVVAVYLARRISPPISIVERGEISAT